MKTNLHAFLNSGLLDKYILGDASITECIEVEHYISEYSEVANEYERLQSNLEIIAKSHAVNAPKGVLQAVFDDIEETPVIALKTKKSVRTPWYSIAASFAALMFAASSFFLYEKNLELVEENQVVVDEIFDLRGDIDENNAKFDDVMRQFLQLNNPETEKYVLRGNSRAKNLKTVAYINAINKTSMIDVVSLPKLPEEQQYQMWAELQDRMVSLGILDANDRKLQSIPYLENALGLSITIESKNKGTNEASAENEVAEVALKNK